VLVVAADATATTTGAGAAVVGEPVTVDHWTSIEVAMVGVLRTRAVLQEQQQVVTRDCFVAVTSRKNLDRGG